MEKIKKSFIRGAAILTIAGLISKVLGAVYRVPYQNLTGDEGIYVYQQVYPLYSLLVIFATAGFPVAISKMVAARIAQGDGSGAKNILRFSFFFLFSLGLLSFLGLFFSAPLLAEWMGNRQMLTQPIQAVSFALLVVPLVASLRGYAQGFQEMMPTAISQVVEQVVRVSTILFSAWFFMSTGYGVVWAGSGAMFGAFTGGLIGFFCLWFFCRTHLPQPTQTQKGLPQKGKLLKQMLLIAIPICLSAMVWPLFSLVDSFTVANLLQQTHWSLTEAIQQKGVYDRGQPLIQFASFFATALSLSIVPAITEAKIQKREKEVQKQAQLAIRLTLLMGMPASIGLALVARPTNILLYQDGKGSLALGILAFTALFSTLGLTLTGILQGIGRLYFPVLVLLAGVVLKILGNEWLVPMMGIDGAALATVIGYAIPCILLFWITIHSQKWSPFSIRWLMQLLISIAVMGIAVFFTKKALYSLTSVIDSLRLAMGYVTFLTILVGIFLFLWLTIYFQLLTREDLQQLPSKVNRFYTWLSQLRLFVQRGANDENLDYRFGKRKSG